MGPTAMVIRRLGMLLKLVLVLLPVAVLKTLAMARGWEVLEPTPLFAGLITSNVFLIGFLFNGVLIDYKESEKCPAQLAETLLSLVAELQALGWARPEAQPAAALATVAELGPGFLGWFQGTTRAKELLDLIERLNGDLAQLRSTCESPCMARLLQELASLRGLLLRMETIRSIPFVPTVYWLSATSTTLLCAGLVLTRMDDLVEIFFYLGAIAFLMVFILLLIWDLDNPFGHGEFSSCENISLAPLERTMARITHPRNPEG
ncbi:hypothetical protein [Cyanobium sp. Morenito 9A2]|uniref:hypothetical protein n=1 Tax=Cyanobium sp. Morenito 9A2 TaxID=2823718 RepID=UPI0020CCF829|nr:hypothetical protein [Cyanobium sp. Morenito 9A2]MCP9850880.1 hypothetical protein [Cyanobium sp. Morenito 9A2]